MDADLSNPWLQIYALAFKLPFKLLQAISCCKTFSGLSGCNAMYALLLYQCTEIQQHMA